MESKKNTSGGAEVLAFKEGRRDPKKPARCSQQMARRPSAAGRHPRHSTKPSRSLPQSFLAGAHSAHGRGQHAARLAGFVNEALLETSRISLLHAL
jgi:hypothetical protein